MTTLGKNERLKKRKLIEQLFNSGKSYSVFPIKILFQFLPLAEGCHLQSGFAASKKSFKRSVDRNRIKRQLKEAYRLQKKRMQDLLKQKNLQLAVFWIYTGSEKPAFEMLFTKVGLILSKLEETIHARSAANT